MGIYNGDILFINSKASNALLMEKASRSKYNHCGVLIITTTGPKVLEVTPSKIALTDFAKFTSKANGLIATIRLKDREKYKLDSTAADFTRIREEAQKFTTKIPDKYFNWNDSALYSSELVWKFYKKVFDIELCELETLKDFDTKNSAVKKVLSKGYGKEIPLNETAISINSLYKSKLLYTANVIDFVPSFDD